MMNIITALYDKPKKLTCTERGKMFFRKKQGEGKKVPVISDILYTIYKTKYRLLRTIILKIIIKIEDGFMFSLTIRKIFSVYHQVDVGMYSSSGCFIEWNFRPGTVIGRYCVIYRTVQAFNANHPMNTLSVHSFFYNTKHGYAKQNIISYTKLTIGNDVFLGHNVIILPSVSSIGDGAIVGAGSVVHTDIPPYAVVVGNPCRIVRFRFSNEKIDEIIKSKWWEKSIDELSKNMGQFQQPLDNNDSIR
ncbi:MAG: CatB-related O-acetyltransferase [Candidatus Latescibacterota bacterium]